MKNKKIEYIGVEYGSINPTQIANSYLYDSEGKVVLCKCGNPAETAIIGEKAYVARCNKCMGYEESPYKLVYRPLNESI